MKVAYYDSHTSREPTTIDADWNDIRELLTDIPQAECTAENCIGKNCPHKYGSCWSPVFMDGTRLNENVREVTLAVYDLDHVSGALISEIATRLEGREFLIHSTHTRHCYRLVMSLSRPILPAEWPSFWLASTKLLDLPVDKAVKDAARLFFLPTTPAGREPYVYVSAGTMPLDVEHILANAPRRATAIAGVSEPDDEESEPVEVGDLRTALAGYRRRKASSTSPDDAIRYTLMGRVLHGEALAPRGERDSSVNQAAALLAFILPANTPTEAAVELLRPSIAAMEYAEGEPEDAPFFLAKAARKYENAQERRRARDEDRARADERIRERFRGPATSTIAQADTAIAHADTTGDKPAGSLTKLPIATVVDGERLPDENAWMVDLIPQASGGIKSCGYNACLILQHAEGVGGCLRFNEVTKDVEVIGGRFAGVSPDVLDTKVQGWLMKAWNVSLSVADVGAQLMLAARANAYDPLRDYLKGIAWDGTRRLDDFLTKYLGAETKTSMGKDVAEHVRSIGRKWMISAVARALDPGCQVDTVLVLEGVQGVRKTSALRVLGGEYTTETAVALGEKDGMMLATRYWLIELSEFAALKRSETAAQKAFLTTRVDAYRPPYGRTLMRVPRRCVFVATVNPDEGGYLMDKTGNRRYWPVYCTRIDLEALKRDRDQLWAEAVAAFESGERWWLTDDEQSQADELTAEREAESGLEVEVARWFYGMHPTKRPAEIDTVSAAKHAFPDMPVEKAISRGVQMEVGTALRKMGCDKRRVMKDGVRRWVYAPTSQMMKAPQGANAVFGLVHGQKESSGQAA